MFHTTVDFWNERLLRVWVEQYVGSNKFDDYVGKQRLVVQDVRAINLKLSGSLVWPFLWIRMTLLDDYVSGGFVRRSVEKSFAGK